ncbi:MAG: hypothetical protein ACOC0K_01145 [bacterium]
MTSKFDGLTTDPDTKILFRKEVKLGKFDVLHEKWNWEGITAESLIFVSEDVKDMDDGEIEELVADFESFDSGSSITLKRSESGFTFVNFNFET